MNHFAIPADVPDRAITFYQEVFGWRFEAGWEYRGGHAALPDVYRAPGSGWKIAKVLASES